MGFPESGIQVKFIEIGGDPRKPCLENGEGSREGQEAIEVLSQSARAGNSCFSRWELQKAKHSACLEVGSWAVYPHTPTCPRLRAASRGINSSALPAAAGRSLRLRVGGSGSSLWHREETQAGLYWQAVLAKATRPAAD